VQACSYSGIFVFHDAFLGLSFISRTGLHVNTVIPVIMLGLLSNLDVCLYRLHGLVTLTRQVYQQLTTE
jgi:hypothetical protein